MLTSATVPLTPPSCMALVLPTAVFSQHTIPGTGEGLLSLGKIPSYRILFARQNSFVPDTVCLPEFLRTGYCFPARIPSYRILFARQKSKHRFLGCPAREGKIFPGRFTPMKEPLVPMEEEVGCGPKAGLDVLSSR